MNREWLLATLALCERHVSEGEEHIARQRDRIALLDLYGWDTSQAVYVLQLLQTCQDQHEEHRDRLLGELFKPVSGKA